MGSIAPLLLLHGTTGALGEVCGYLGLGPGPDADFWRDFEDHEYHVRGRLAGVSLTDPRLRELTASLPEDLP